MVSRSIVCVLIAVSVSMSASAQDLTSPPVITSTGIADYRVAPTRVEFSMEYITEDAPFEIAMRQASAFEAEVRLAMVELKLEAMSITARAPRIPNVSESTTVTYITLIFEVPSAADSGDQAEDFGALCDTMIAVADAVSGNLSGPFLLADIKEPHERIAVQHATENALLRAAPVAELMSSQIYEVEKVDIKSVEWIATSEDQDAAPTLDGVTCRATVEVTYRHQP
jgi:uncharacterized protein YggE